MRSKEPVNRLSTGGRLEKKKLQGKLMKTKLRRKRCCKSICAIQGDEEEIGDEEDVEEDVDVAANDEEDGKVRETLSGEILLVQGSNAIECDG